MNAGEARAIAGQAAPEQKVEWTTDAELCFTSYRGPGPAPLPGEIAGWSLMELSSMESGAVAAHLRALAGESVAYEQEIGGRLFRCHVEPLRDPAGQPHGCIGVGLDVSGRQQGEDGLQVLTGTLAALIEASPLAILALDTESRVTLWSPSAERTFGWSREEVLGQMLPTIPEDRWSEHLALRGSLLAGERFTGIETRRRDKAGSLIDVRISAAPLRDASGRVRGIAEFVEDINDRRRAERAIRRLASLPEQSPDPLVELDFAGNALYVNQAARLRFPDLQALGTWHPVLAPLSPVLARFRQGERKSFSFEVEHEGAVYHQMVYYVPEGHVVRAFLHDVTEQRRAQELLARQASLDSLTGLANRDAFLRLVGERLRAADAAPCAVLALDLDRFKVFNDSLGHLAGDELLAGVGKRIAACLGPGGSAARLGGDEFAVLLRETLGLSEAQQVAEQLCEAVGLPLELRGQEVFLSAAIGIAPGEGYRDAELLLRDARVAMYRAKAQGGGRCAAFEPAMGHRSLDRLRLENELRRAVERRELRLFYQPIVDLRDGSIVAFEALMRWPRPDGSMVPPAEFIPVAEESGLILPISYWALGEVCRCLQDWSPAADDGAPVSIHLNVSAKLFADPGLAGRIRAALQEAHVVGDRLVLEITESVLVEEPEAIDGILTRIREQGVQVSIDDFGTGYSSLSYLQRFPIDSLKIDRSFVARIGDEGDHAEIPRAILSLARSLDIGVVAEGVETDAQLRQLVAMGCDMAQGYVFSRPVEQEAARALLVRPPAWADLLRPLRRPALRAVGGNF